MTLNAFSCLVLLCAILVPAQDTTKTIALTDKSNVPIKDLLKSLEKECPNVSLTNDPTKNNYTLEAIKTSPLILVSTLAENAFR